MLNTFMTAIKAEWAPRTEEKSGWSVNRRTPSLLLKLLVKKRQLDVRKKNGLWDSLCILAASHVHVCSEVTGSLFFSLYLSLSFLFNENKMELFFGCFFCCIPFPVICRWLSGYEILKSRDAEVIFFVE